MTDEKPRTLTRQEADQAQQDHVERLTAETFAETRAELSGRFGIRVWGGVPLAKDGSVTVPRAALEAPVTPTPPRRIRRRQEPLG